MENKQPQSEKKSLFSRYNELSYNKRFLILYSGIILIFVLAGLILGLALGDSMNWYGFLIGAAIVLCVVFGHYAAVKQGYYNDLVFDYVIVAVPFAFLGGVFYYAAFNNWRWGGIGVLGGLIGAGIGLVLIKFIYAKFTKKPRVKMIQMLDLASVFFLLGQAIGRIGCIFAGCCYGVEVNFDLFPLSYHVHGGLHLGNPFIESVWCGIGFIVMAIMYLSNKKCFNGFFISLYCIWYGVERFVLEFFRADAEKLVLPGIDFGISQLVSLFMIAFGIIWIAQYLIRAKLSGKKIMLFVPKENLSDEYFGYSETIYANPWGDGEGNPIKPDKEDSDFKDSSGGSSGDSGSENDSTSGNMGE